LRDFSLSEIKEIASEAGLDTEFVEQALREREARDLMTRTPTDRQTKLASRFLGTSEDRITVSHVVSADKETTLDALQQILPAAPYGLELLDVIGGDDSQADATLVFKVPQVDAKGLLGAEGGASSVSFSYNMTIATPAFAVNGAGWFWSVVAPLLIALAVAALSIKDFGVAYRGGLKKGEKEMAELLHQINVHVRTGGTFKKE
jgi:hypothetical protein